MSKRIGYVDGYILPLPRKNLAEYKKMARLSARVWKDHGALDYVEAIGDDVPEGTRTSFQKSVKLKKGETVVFAWATFKSRAHRDRAMKKIMDDPRLAHFSVETLPFDGMRMFWGGFKPFVQN